MELIDEKSLLLRGIGPCAVAVGTFDGVHIGHRRLIEATVERARKSALAAVVLTFEPHPAQVLGRRSVRRLSSVEEKRELLADCGVDYCVTIAFDAVFARLSPAAFVRRWFHELLGARVVFVGFNFHFGRRALGSVEVLGELAEAEGIELEVVEGVEAAGDVVSSTRVRELLAAGSVEDAGLLLGRPYHLRGTVVPGEGRGRTLGFPTANVDPVDPRKLVPAYGVYIGGVRGGQLGRSYRPCLISVGLSPTFGARELPRIEVYVPGQAMQLYGAVVDVLFEEWIRAEIRFDSVEDLIARMHEDLACLHERKKTVLPVGTGRSTSQKEMDDHGRFR